VLMKAVVMAVLAAVVMAAGVLVALLRWKSW
jgi:hypothetical protein